MGTLRVISIVLLFFFFASLLIHPIYSINQDIGRHIKSGEIIWQTKEVYKTNLFSFTEPGHPFINHHWLSEITFYGLNGLFGLKGLIVFKTVVLVAALLFIYLAVRQKVSLWAFGVSALTGIFIFIERTDVRPEIFSYLFLSFFLFAIFRAKYSNQTKWLYALPIVQIFWTNMHIYFALGPVLLLFFIIDQKKFYPIFLATCAATLLNPNLISGALYPLKILNNYGYTIVENQNIFFLRDYGVSLGNIQTFQLSVALLIASFAIIWKKNHPDIFETLTTGFFTVMAFMMLRNFGIYALTFIPIVALNLSTLKPLNGVIHKIGYVTLSIILALLIWQNVRADRFGLVVPSGAEKAVEFVKTNNVSGPVFNNFDVGSFLIWKMYPERKVFVDGRPEAYSVEFFEKIYKLMQEDQAVWEKYSEEYKINYVFFDHHDMTPWAQKFLATISKNPDWPLVYIDQSVAIFVKRTQENKNLIGRFKIDTP